MTPYKSLKPDNISDLTWKTLIGAWENGLSDREASLLLCKNPEAQQMTAAEIRKLYSSSPDLSDLKAVLSLELVASSKLTVAEAVRSGDLKTAKWYLERKAANEFSTRSSVEFENAVVAISMDDREKMLKEYIESFEDNE